MRTLLVVVLAWLSTLKVCYSEEVYRGIVRRPTTVTCFNGCGDLYLEPDTGSFNIYLTDPSGRYLSGGYVGMHVQVAGYRSNCESCTPLFLTKPILVLPPDGAGDDRPLLPGAFILNQNFPNPFNSATRLEFSLPSEAYVELTISDLSGHRLLALISGRQSPGMHVAYWHAVDEPSGIYVARLFFLNSEDAPQTISRRMVLLR